MRTSRLPLLSGLTLALAVAVPLALPLAARAEEAADAAAHRAAAVALLDQLHPTDAVNAMMPNLIEQIRIGLTHNDPTLVRTFNEIAPQLAAEGEAAKPELIDKIVDIYAATFTTEEMKDVTAFYASPVGQKMISTQPKVTGDTLTAVREWGTKVARKMADEARAKLLGKEP